MRLNGKKTWIDLLVEMANTRKTRAEKKLWEMLRAIARSKEMPPKEILDELDRVNRKYHLAWTTVPPELEWFVSPRELYKVEIDEKGRKILYGADDENPEKWVMVRGKDGEPLEAIEVYESGGVKLGKRKQPHLGSWGPLQMYDHYLFELIPRLRDPTWVRALRICPGCGNLLMSTAEWKNKFCSDRCKKANWARVNRRHVYCLFEGKEITLLQCRQTQNDLPYDECEICPNRPKKKKGGRYGSNRKRKG